MNDMEKYAYMAGLIDGEGTITFNRRKEKYSARGSFVPRLIIPNTNKDIINWLKSEFGGSIYVIKRKEKHNQCFWWYIGARKALKILQNCYPFLVGKREQAKLYFQYYETIQKTNTPITLELTARRLAIYQKLKELNKREPESLIAPVKPEKELT